MKLCSNKKGLRAAWPVLGFHKMGLLLLALGCIAPIQAGLALALQCAAPVQAELPAWEFDQVMPEGFTVKGDDNVVVKFRDGCLSLAGAKAGSWVVLDRFCLPTTRTQAVVFRIRADHVGNARVYWVFNDGKGAKRTQSFPLQVRQADSWQTVAIAPLWTSGKKVTSFQIRLFNANIEIDSIRVVDTHADSSRLKPEEVGRWPVVPQGNGLVKAVPDGSLLIAPEFERDFGRDPIAAVKLTARKDCHPAVVWSAVKTAASFREPFFVRGDGVPRVYNVTLDGKTGVGFKLKPNGAVSGLALEIPTEMAEYVNVEWVELTRVPLGPPNLEISYLGFEEGANRAGETCTLLADFRNYGGEVVTNAQAELILPDGLHLVEGTSAQQPVPDIPFSFRTDGWNWRTDRMKRSRCRWNVVADQPGDYNVKMILRSGGRERDGGSLTERLLTYVKMILRSGGRERTISSSLHFIQPVNLPVADYVPSPRPVETDVETMMYFFPYFDTYKHWNWMRANNPERKPILGFMDINNPEVVDWQIKWALENGINGFIVCWYWDNKVPEYDRWLTAFLEKARYRDDIKLMILWANYAPPSSYSQEGFSRAMAYLREHYFGLKNYYRIDGKPALMIWQPNLMSKGMGGVQGLRKAVDRAKSETAGGLVFLRSGWNPWQSPDDTSFLEKAGFEGFTSYNVAIPMASSVAPSPQEGRYEDIVRLAPASWANMEKNKGSLMYFPVVSTGWFKSPWEGRDGMEFHGRTPELFEQHLRDAKKFVKAHNSPFLVIGPCNEWGEGSYIEPCTEYGFEMYEAIRKVFGKGSPTNWPVNIKPSDVGLGPYDLPTDQ